MRGSGSDRRTDERRYNKFTRWLRPYQYSLERVWGGVVGGRLFGTMPETSRHVPLPGGMLEERGGLHPLPPNITGSPRLIHAGRRQGSGKARNIRATLSAGGICGKVPDTCHHLPVHSIRENGANCNRAGAKNAREGRPFRAFYCPFRSMTRSHTHI